MAKRMTNAMLVDENIRLRAQCDVLERKIARLETEQREFTGYAPVRAPHSSKPDARDFEGYWDYVRAVRDWAHANNKPVSYKTREQFNEAREFA